MSPSPLVFLRISTHFTTTPGIPHASTYLKYRSFAWPRPVEPERFHTRLTIPPARALHPVNPDNVRLLRFTAAAGTWLAETYSGGTVLPLPPEKWFTTRRPSSHTRRCCVRLSPIVAISLTAASRRSRVRVSVPVWGVTLSGPLPVLALVGRYPTN